MISKLLEIRNEGTAAVVGYLSAPELSEVGNGMMDSLEFAELAKMAIGLLVALISRFLYRKIDDLFSKKKDKKND